ncbi:MAG: alpha/beta hydrolase fold domain-containing protein [Flavobacteriales bacterium]
MKQTLSYYITLLALKLKGVKKDFSKDPIDFKKIRKEDVHSPKSKFFQQNILRDFKVLDSLITEIGLNHTSDKLLIYVHGGAFISGPTQLHWDSAKNIAKQTNHKIWMCEYPKAPENKISKISENIDSIYNVALESFHPNNISFIGDSVGGTLILCLIQRLIINEKIVPNKIILVTPVMDASMSNPEIEEIDKLDPILSKNGVLSAKNMCAENNNLKNVMISPLFGSFDNFPHTFLFLAENDIMYPDGKLAEMKMKKANVNLEVIKGNNMPHIWPYLPLMKEAKTALNEIIKIINN